MIKKATKGEELRTDREINTPTFYLLGFSVRAKVWRAARKGLVSYLRGIEIMEKGDRRFSRMMLVSQLEFNVLGVPKDKDASLYHSIEGQRLVTEAAHGRKGNRKGGRCR